ncbi:androglobin [Nomia melanderi]|uniref:androglobin n=1 Tax=Nomia melanderi TaxID=2448451 RepID=UPI003FCCDEC8
MKTLSSETVPGLSPCENHLIFIAQIRDIPLDPEDVKPPLARWKHFRWVKWASEKGMINPADYFAPIRFLKIVSPLKSFGETIINKHTDEIVEKADEKDVSDPKSTPKRTEKTKSRDRSKESKSQTPKPSVKKTPEKAPPFDITFWADFNKMGPYVKDVHFFYKLDYFQYTARVSDRFTVKDSHDKKIDSKKSSKKGSREHSPVRITSREAKFIDIHCWPQKMLKSRNEPLYLFVDSLEEKFFLINFSTFQVSADPQASSSVSEEDANKSTDDLANQSNDLQTVSRFTRLVAIKDYLIIERHSWFHRQKYGNDLVHLLTTGTRSTVLELESGRHLLRMYCGSEANCFVTISSDTIFHLGDRRKMYELMCTESDAIDLKVRHISNCASNAYQSFGTDKYPEALKLYYNSYLPPAYNSRAKIFYSYIHACFLNEKVRLIQGLVPADQMQGILRSLRIFFLNPMIGLEYFNPFTRALKAIRNSNTPRTSIERQKLIDQSPTEANVLNKDYAASVIQSLFKTLLIIRYKMIHNPKHREHRAVLENLLKVVELFNYNKRESLATHLFRYILKHFDRLRDIYPCSKDFEHTIQVQKLTGTLGVVKPGQWVPIARFLVNTKTMETAFANIDLFINLPRYCVRVFNNETKQEMLRVVNNVVPTRYEHTKSGYTVFAYGWSDDQLIKEVTWTMFMITKKGQPVFYSMDETISQSTTLATPFLVTEELSNAYIPNSRKYISKWIAKISKPTLVSFRLSTSYDKVKIKFRVTDTEGTVLLEMTGGSVVIVPLVFLGLEAESSEIQLMIDAKSEGGRPIRNDTNGKAMNEAGNDTVEDSTVKTDVNGSKASEETLCHRTYHVEAFVLDDSWPLTKSEWIAVTEVKMRPVGSAVRPKSSTLTIGKFSKAEVSKIKRAAKALTDSNQVLEKPYCVLQVVTDVGSGFEIAEDKLSEQQIAKMKETWAKNDPESLSRGKLLQENFRQKYEFTPKPSETDTKSEASVPGRKSSVKLECCVETPAISEIRTLEPPLLFRRLPTLDLTIYENREDEEDTPWVKTPYDEEILRCRRAVNIIYAQEDYDYFIEEMNGLMKNRRERYRMLLKEHEELFRERKAMVEEVYEARKAYIAGTNPGSVRGSKKSAKTKSSKSKKV